MKKLLAVLLVLCLFVGMMPMAFAEGEPVDEAPAATENVGETETPKDDTVPNAESPDAEDPNADNPDAKNPDAKNPNAENPEAENPNAYNPNSINSLDELKRALAAKAPRLVLGQNMELTGDLTIDYDVTLVGHNGTGFTGSGSITVAYGADVRFEGLTVGAPVNVDRGASLYVDKDCDVKIDITGNGQIDYEGSESETDPEQKYTVTFSCTPRDLEVYIDGSPTPVNKDDCKLVNGTYEFTATHPDCFPQTKTVVVNGSNVHVSFNLTYKPKEYVTAVPSVGGSVGIYNPNEQNDWVYFKVWPDGGYYLTDITVKMLNGRELDVEHVWDNVYRFWIGEGYAYISTTFKALPDEYRVYIANTEHGTVSVDTRYAEEGEWVYITVKPDAGYRLDELTVTRPSGNEVKVYHVRDNVFRFKMPGVRVTVDAEFVRSSLPFSDVSRGQWFYDYVAWAYNTGLMEGVSAGRFAPNSTTTRAMVVTIIYRLAGSPGVSGTSDFTDVPAGAWYADAVTWAAKRGIVEGMTATTFDPNDAVTREELAAMLYRYAQHKGYDTSAAENTNILSYNDAGSISEYAFEALQWACGEGIINGTGGGSLEPGGSATRAQLAAMLYRFCAEYVY